MTEKKLLKRRQFLKGAALTGAAVGTSVLATPAIAQGKTEWKMVTTWPKNFPGLGTGANMRALFKRHLGVSPQDYRRRFTATTAPDGGDQAYGAIEAAVSPQDMTASRQRSRTAGRLM